MKVKIDYYDITKFDRPDKVTEIVHWAKRIMKANKMDSPKYLVAKRIKSLCLKHYKLMRGSDARFDEIWENNPELMLQWILDRYPSGECKLVRIKKKQNFSPYNIDLQPLSDKYTLC